MNGVDGSWAVDVKMGWAQLWLRIGFPNPALAAKRRAELDALRAERIKVTHGGMA